MNDRTRAIVDSSEASPSYEMNPDDYAQLLTMPGNSVCVDCGEKKPDWGSPKLGILFCFQCSAKHRGLGTHLSFVRSVKMDAWTDKQMAHMKVGGNQQCNEFLQKHGIDIGTASVGIKYDSPAAELYRQVLHARVEGKPEPTTLPVPPKEVKNKEKPKKMQGFGSSPPPKKKTKGGKVKRAFKVVAPVAAAAGAVAGAIFFLKRSN